MSYKMQEGCDDSERNKNSKENNIIKHSTTQFLPKGAFMGSEVSNGEEVIEHLKSGGPVSGFM